MAFRTPMNLNYLKTSTYQLDLLQKFPRKDFFVRKECLYINVAVRSLLVDPFVSDCIMVYLLGLFGQRCYRKVVTQRIKGFPVLKYEPKDLKISFNKKNLDTWYLLFFLNEIPYAFSPIFWKWDGQIGFHCGVSSIAPLYEKDPFSPYYCGFHINYVLKQEPFGFNYDKYY